LIKSTSRITGVPPFSMDKANQGPRFVNDHDREVVKCVSVLALPIPPWGTPSAAGVDTFNHPMLVTYRKIPIIHESFDLLSLK